MLVAVAMGKLWARAAIGRKAEKRGGIWGGGGGGECEGEAEEVDEAAGVGDPWVTVWLLAAAFKA